MLYKRRLYIYVVSYLCPYYLFFAFGTFWTNEGYLLSFTVLVTHNVSYFYFSSILEYCSTILHTYWGIYTIRVPNIIPNIIIIILKYIHILHSCYILKMDNGPYCILYVLIHVIYLIVYRQKKMKKNNSLIVLCSMCS